MKKIFFTLLIIGAGITKNFGQTPYYDVAAGNGYGLRFWSSDNYKIHMGNASDYHYGPVTDYSIKMNMSGDPGRGWTWGLPGITPIAALSNAGHMQVAGTLMSGGIIGVNGVGVINTVNDQNNIYINGRVVRNESTVYQDGMYLNYNSIGGAVAHLRFYANGTTERMRIDASTGNVGIGTTSPELANHIQGNTGFPASSGVSQIGVLRLQGIGSNGVLDFSVNAGSGASLQMTNRGNLALSYPLILNPNGGSVGIGTTTPGSFKLAVNGKIWGTEVQVALANPGPDYVFEKSYALPTLEEVKSYIDQNKHLPEVPSAKEMEANGVNVGEMNMLLLKKIEELTLYTIEMNKRMKVVSEENKELKNRIEKIENK